MLHALRNFQSKTKADIAGIVCNYETVVDHYSGGAVVVKDGHASNLRGSIISLSDILKGNLFPPIAFLYERRALDSVGPYDEALPVLGDWEWNIRFLRQFDIGIVPEVYARYHQRSETGAPNADWGNSVASKKHLHVLTEQWMQNEMFRSAMQDDRMTGVLAIVTKMQSESQDALRIAKKKITKTMILLCAATISVFLISIAAFILLAFRLSWA